LTKNEMHVQRDSFFRIFSSELRGALQYFFENRRARITPEIASECVDLATLERLVALGLIEFDGESGEYRLGDRTERYLDEMLGVKRWASFLAFRSRFASVASRVRRLS
jgi:hypothetical protein